MSAAAEQLDEDRVLDFRPRIEMRWEITRSAADTGGEFLETVNRVGATAGAGPPVHVHATAEESYEVREGELEVLLGDRWRTLRAGEAVTVPRGTRHTVRNRSGAPVVLVNTHRPALRFEAMFRQMHGLVATGKMKGLPPKDPRSLLYAAMLFDSYTAEQRFTNPPQALLGVLARIGRAVGLELDERSARPLRARR